jgi:hypothetical protein
MLVLAAPCVARAEPPAPREPAPVYRVSLVGDGAITLAAALAIVLPYALSSSLITPRCPCRADEVNALDRPAIGNTSPGAGFASDVTVGAVLVAPLVFDAVDVGWSPVLADDALVFAETMAVNGALATAAKFVFQRPLPRTYAGDPQLVDVPAGYRSFYAGHTALTFAGLSATAMTLHLRHGTRWWPWLVTLAVGASVSVERVADGRHFVTDVLVGAFVGTAVGVAVPWLHARAAAGHLVVVPGEAGVQLGWTGRF